VAPGLRLGWVTAAPAVIQKLVYYLHGISLGACSFTQARRRRTNPPPCSDGAECVLAQPGLRRQLLPVTSSETGRERGGPAATQGPQYAPRLAPARFRRWLVRRARQAQGAAVTTESSDRDRAVAMPSSLASPPGQHT